MACEMRSAAARGEVAELVRARNGARALRADVWRGSMVVVGGETGERHVIEGGGQALEMTLI